MGKKKMEANDARRIQSHADKTGKNQDFKARAQRAAEKNKNKILQQHKINNYFFLRS